MSTKIYKGTNENDGELVHDSEAIDFASHIVPPHKKKSREVTEKDLPTVMEAAHIMYNLCYTQLGPIRGCYAIHHSQIESKHPLNFFVTRDKEVIINPGITNHTKVPVERIEGCASFAYNPPINVKRFNKVTVSCSTLTNEGKISPAFIKNLSGVDAQVYQHETDHSKGIYPYDIKDYKEYPKDDPKK